MIDLLLRVTFDPIVASSLAAHLVGEPELAPELVATCWREAPLCQLRGEHRRDAGASRAVWKAAMRRGWLSPHCSWHWYTDSDGDRRNFSTSSPWGTMRGYTWRHLARATGLECAPMQLLDVPILGALATALRMQAACDVYGACTRYDRKLLWAGLGRFKNKGTPDERPYRGIFALPWRAAP